MRDLGSGFCQCFFVKDYKGRTRWDCGLVIRSRGRWGKCGWFFFIVITVFASHNSLSAPPLLAATFLNYALRSAQKGALFFLFCFHFGVFRLQCVLFWDSMSFLFSRLCLFCFSPFWVWIVGFFRERKWEFSSNSWSVMLWNDVCSIFLDVIFCFILQKELFPEIIVFLLGLFASSSLSFFFLGFGRIFWHPFLHLKNHFISDFY